MVAQRVAKRVDTMVALMGVRRALPKVAPTVGLRAVQMAAMKAEKKDVMMALELAVMMAANSVGAKEDAKADKWVCWLVAMKAERWVVEKDRMLAAPRVDL